MIGGQAGIHRTPANAHAVFADNDASSRAADMPRARRRAVVDFERPAESPCSLDVRLGADDKREFLLLNVGGFVYRVRAQTLYRRRREGTLVDFALADHEQRLERVDGFFADSGQYYFERSPALFEPIYRYYVTGQLHRPSDVCVEEFKRELSFWRIPFSAFSSCCAPPAELMPADDSPSRSPNGKANLPDEFDTVRLGDCRRRVWNIIEEPASSTFAQVFAFCSIGFVITSIVCLILGSIRELQVEVAPRVADVDPLSNVTAPAAPTEAPIREPHPVFMYVEYVCIGWFTLEYLGKVAAATQRVRVMLGFLSVVDVLAIIPFYMELAMQLSGFNTEQLREIKGAFLVVRILRVLRVVRIFKLGRYSSGLQNFAITIKTSLRQLGMMAMVLSTAIVFFSTLLYFLEKDDPESKFDSIPAGFWWCLVTMTTVGYGDIVPVTIPGKLVASGAIACGVLVLALPITIIVDNFMKVSGSNLKAFGQG